MSRPVLALLAVLALVVGIAVGIGAGALAQPGASPTPVAMASELPAPSAGDTGSPGSSPSTAPSDTASMSPAPTPTPVPTPTPEPTPVLVPAPLTGAPVTEHVANRPVIAVMIDDLWAARPQMGLSQADVVWHAPAEGGIPRYMAMFQSQFPTRLGPVRSSRLYYVGWASEWTSVYVHAGGSPQAIEFLRANGRGQAVYNADWSRFLYRVTFRSAPHNLYSDRKNVKEIPKSVGAKAVKGQKPAWSFAPDAPLELRPAGGTIIVPYTYNKVTYKYNRASNTYRRSVSVEGRQFDIGTTPKTRIAPKNVVVMKVSFVPIGDKKHRLDGHITGTGPAWIATNGVTVKGTWKKKRFDSPTRFFGPDGLEVTLTIGQTFVQVVTRSTVITVKDGKVPVA